MSGQLSRTVLLCALVFVQNDAQIHMQEGLTLINGTATQGLLRLNYNGRSGLLCAEGIGRQEGQVICRDLEVPHQYPNVRAVPLPSGAAFLGSSVDCSGSEIKLSDCYHDEWGRASCNSGQAVFISCSADPCHPSPCQNGGTCQRASSNQGYQCLCPSTWTGPDCSADKDECLVNNGGCSETCVNEDGGYSCKCTQNGLELAADNHTCWTAAPTKHPGENVTCNSDGMEITFEKSSFPSFHREHLTLSDTTCGATDNGTHIILSAPLTACGTVSEQAGNTIIYKNVVHSKEEIVDGLITRVKEVQIAFQCVMTLEEIKEVPVHMVTEELHFLLEGSGHHDVQLQFSTSEQHHPNQGHVEVYPGQDIYGQVVLATIDPNLSVVLSNCSATTNVSHSSTDSPYSVLQKGCAEDSTFVLENVTDSVMQEFHLEAFKFLDNTHQVVFHCDAVLCDVPDADPLCAGGCTATN